MSETNAEFNQWFTYTFGNPKNSQQEIVMACCYHAWVASRESMKTAEKTKAVMFKAVDDWEGSK